MALPEGVTKLGEFKGERGEKGETGTFASVTVTMLATNATPTWAITGPQDARVLELGIPRGATGLQGIQGPGGTITSVTVTMLAPDAAPTVSLGGTATARTIALGLPRGQKGDTGAASTVPGPEGPQGPPGGSDSATATYVAQTSSQTRAALAAWISPLLDAKASTQALADGLQGKAAVSHSHGAADLPTASTAAAGIARLATTAEATASTPSASLSVTPAGLAAFELLRRPKRDRAVFVGSSNVADGSTPANMWPAKLCAIRGWIKHNYAIGGTAYTNTNNFLSQAQAAASALTSAQRLEVGHFFVGDASNNMRAKTPASEVLAAAKTLYAYIRATFPNARIVVVPAIWPSDTARYAPQEFAYEVAWNGFAVAHSEAQREALADFPNSVFADNSWTWLTGLDQYMTQLRDVHPNAAGMTLIANYVDRVLEGESIQGSAPWTTVPISGSATSGGRGAPYRVRRMGWDVWLEGSAYWTNGSSSGWDIGFVPEAFKPTYLVPVTALRGDTFAPIPAEVWPTNGAIRVYQALPATVAVFISGSYQYG